MVCTEENRVLFVVALAVQASVSTPSSNKPLARELGEGTAYAVIVVEKWNKQRTKGAVNRIE
jgi:hypothetical protein